MILPDGTSARRLSAHRRRTPPRASESLHPTRRASGFETQFVLSAITVMELEHGWHRAPSQQIADEWRRRFLDSIYEAFPVVSFTREIGQTAARIDAESRRQGNVIPVADLGIGTTAIHLGFDIATDNERHFRMIAGSRIVSW